MTNIARAYDQIASWYDSFYGGRLDLNEDRLVSTMLRGYTGGQVVDLGCGTAHALSLDGLDSDRYTGIDISSKMLEQARRKWPDARFCLQDMQATSIEEGTVDNVISLYGSFSYARYPMRVVDEIYRLLTEGGRFFIMVYAQGHRHKKRYCLADRPEARCLWRQWDLYRLFVSDFARVQARPFSYRELPSWIPPLWYQWIDRALGLTIPDEATFHIVTGQKVTNYADSKVLSNRQRIRRGP